MVALVAAWSFKLVFHEILVHLGIPPTVQTDQAIMYAYLIVLIVFLNVNE